ncbi:unnamed protein product, partial [Ectocarpus sp. 12 AP-2014]
MLDLQYLQYSQHVSYASRATAAHTSQSKFPVPFPERACTLVHRPCLRWRLQYHPLLTAQITIAATTAPQPSLPTLLGELDSLLDGGCVLRRGLRSTPIRPQDGHQPPQNPRSNCAGLACKGFIRCPGNHSKDELKESLVSSMSICTISLHLTSVCPSIPLLPPPHSPNPSDH